VAIDLSLSETKPIESILGHAKTPTTRDTSQGIEEALKRIIETLSRESRDNIIAVNIGTTVSSLNIEIMVPVEFGN
jgi:fatty acid-binding protein DegV